MLYTATSRAEDGKVQRVGLAWSDDLFTWERHGEPVVVADPELYETWDPETEDWHDEAWRDPWVFAHDGWWHMYVTARVSEGNPRGRGVIGHARSKDLVHWDVLPPVSAPMGFGQLEVPQLVELGGRHHLLFCSDVETQADELRPHVPGTGTYVLEGEAPLGPWTGPAHALEAGEIACTYAGRVVQDASGVPWFLAWERADHDGRFVGRITDPQRVYVDDGRLHLAPDPSSV